MKFHANKDTTYRIIVWVLGLLFFGLSLGLFVPVYNEAGLGAVFSSPFCLGLRLFYFLAVVSHVLHRDRPRFNHSFRSV